MSLCYFIADQIHRWRKRRGLLQEQARQRDVKGYWRWQFETSEAFFEKFFDLKARLRAARVIDVGCGLGGRTCYLASQGVAQIVGTDTNHTEIESALELSRQNCPARTLRNIEFRKVVEDEAVSEAGQFDIALLVDSLEHVHDPLAMLNYACTLLRPGGVCYYSTRGWYHHQASHVSSIIPIPFATLWFTDRQILDAVRGVVNQPYYRPTMWDSDPPSERWENVFNLHDRPGEYLNKYTLAGFERAAESSRFSDSELRVQGFSGERHPVLSTFNYLTRIPLIREIYHSAVFGRLIKDGNAQITNSSGKQMTAQWSRAG